MQHGPQMSSYRERAQEAEALSQRAKTPDERAALMEIAALWRQLADKAKEPR